MIAPQRIPAQRPVWAAFDPAAPLGTVAIIFDTDPAVDTDTIRVPGGWILRTMALGSDDRVCAVAHSFIPLPEWAAHS